MITNIDVDKLIDLLIKYKTQVSYLVAFILCAGCFIGGRLTSQCPPKSEVCMAEEKTILGLRAELSGKDTTRVEMLRKQKDEDRKSCDVRVSTAKLEMGATNKFLQCSDVCALYNQCEAAGRCK
tara:strand:+ start:130 stop:501 length:372 start_codon:yes stop_codon:yes gene_type:complete